MVGYINRPVAMARVEKEHEQSAAGEEGRREPQDLPL
jgi:hypothetical protein